MSKNKLFDDNDSEEETAIIKTENEYAKRYDNWREKEEMHKLEQKYGDKDLDAPISSDSEDEDEEPPDMPEEMEAQFLKTLSLLKTKDPRIYDPSFEFFNAADEGNENKDEKNEETPKPKKEVNSLAAAFADSDDDEENDGEIFKVEKKAPVPSKPSKEVKIKEYLSGQVDHVDPNEEKDLAPLRALWSDPKLNQDEAFLRDYILNKRYLEPDSSGGAGKLLDSAALATDEQLVEEQGRFERAYNFRFEEPDQEYLKRYPRTMSSIRPKDDSRARKRAEVRTRKEEEKKRKMDDIARLKALKLKEIQEKLAKIKEVTGNEELAFKDEDIEGDFDPEAHDRRMRAIFDEQYYGGADELKPEFPDLDDELEIENWENYEADGDDDAQAQNGDGPHCEDDDFNMDAEYDPKRARTTLLEEIKETLGKKRRTRKKKSKLAKILESAKPKFIPDVTDKTYDQYMDEYYKMDCEDVIGGDLPTRFRYRETVPNSFGLTIEEILLADDRELNKWASLKKTVKQRPEHVERSEVGTYEARARDQALRRRLLPSLYQELPEEPEVVVPIDGKKKKKKKKKSNASEKTEDTVNTEVVEAIDDASQSKEALSQVEETNQVEVKKSKKRKHKKEVSGIEGDVNNQGDNKILEATVTVTQQNNTENVGKKKKNKRKSEQRFGETTSTDGKAGGQSIKNNNDKNVQSSAAEAKGVTGKNTPKQNKTKNKESKVNTTHSGNATEAKSATVTNVPKQNQNKIKQNKMNKTQSSLDNILKENPQEQKTNKLKRKLDTGPQDGPMKKKNKTNKDLKNNKQKNKQNKNKNKNAKDKGKPDLMSKLSDERLKAYGLNPKKYRSFLKYKKF